MTSGRDIVLDGALAVTLGAGDIIVDSEIVVQGERIAAVRRRRSRRRPGSDVRDVRGRIALPGLVNAHVHSEFLLLKGLVEDQRLREWEEDDQFNHAWGWVRDSTNLKHVRAAYRASYYDAVRGGVTFVGEFNCADSAIASSIEAADECGIRAMPTIDLGRRRKFEAIEARGCMHAIDDEEGLTQDELVRARELLDSGENVRFTMHAAETGERMVLVRARLGLTTVELLHSHGLLGPHMLLSHAIHVTPDEIDLIAQTRTRVVSSPIAEMKLSDGVGPIAEMLARGVPVALGTDAAVCNNSADMFQEMKTAALLQKVTKGAHVVTAEQALLMATLNGARAFGLADEFGTIDVGKKADICFVDATARNLLPLIHAPHHSNVMANLVYCATAADVTDVMIGGRFVVENRTHVDLDEASLLADLQAAAVALHHDIAS